jgi:hypothetical protein
MLYDEQKKLKSLLDKLHTKGKISNYMRNTYNPFSKNSLGLKKLKKVYDILKYYENYDGKITKATINKQIVKKTNYRELIKTTRKIYENFGNVVQKLPVNPNLDMEGIRNNDIVQWFNNKNNLKIFM